MDLLGSRCGVAFEFQADDGYEEESLKSPLEAAVRIKASWLLNGLMASRIWPNSQES